MARILTGIQSTGVPHLGNILGAIKPAIELSENDDNECFYFIADLHSLTTIKDRELLINNTYATAAAWLAFGFDTDNNIFYRQSDVTSVCELAWYLNCFTPIPMLENAHSFKDKSEKLPKNKISAGLFSYPILMAADILLYDANIVPVGKDQKQHLEITRDIAGSFNHTFGETFVIPESKIKKDVQIIPGTDGQKMSKSYNNFIDIFLPEKQLRKEIMKIITDSTPLESPKNPETCNAFKIYSLLGSDSENEELSKKYKAGNFGFGHAKQELFELIMDKFSSEREEFNQYMNHTDEIERKLEVGAQKAGNVAQKVLNRVRTKIGYHAY